MKMRMRTSVDKDILPERSAFSKCEPFLYLLPFLLGIFVFTLYPMVRVVVMSFQERYKLTGSFAQWGFGNYSYVIRNKYFLQALGNTLTYVIFVVPVSTSIAVLSAYLLNQKLRLSALFQTAYFLPMVTSATAVGLVWRLMFNENAGIFNWLISLVNIEKVPWLSKPQWSMFVMVVYGIWHILPFTIILLLSGLQNIDENLYTVARVDGAHAKRIFFRITIPLLAPTIALVVIINSISSFKVFNELFALFKGEPGPIYNLYTVVYYLYEQMNLKREYGRAAAAAIILFLFILMFTMVQLFIKKKWARE